MDRQFAERLVRELAKHGAIVVPNNKLFLDELISTDIPESSRFYEALPNKPYRVEEDGRMHYLSLRRVLRNRNAMDYKLSELKKAYESIGALVGAYSSDALTRNLRANLALLEMMSNCEEPFSLLGKFKTYDFENSKQSVFVVSRPVLIIPGAKDAEPILSWEEANTSYKKEVRLGFFSAEKIIKPREYFSC